MPLLRGFSKVEEEGKLFIPSNIRDKAGISPGSLVEIKIIRIKGSSRWPCIIVHAFGVSPNLSMFQVVMMQEKAELNNESKLILTDNILRELKLEQGFRVEVKLAGSNQAPWVVIYNRGSNRLTTLQEKMARLGKSRRNTKTWETMTVEY